MRNQETIINGLIQGFNNLEGKIQQIIQFVSNLQQAVRLDSTGKEIRLLAIQRLAFKKGLFTEAELTAESGDVIKDMQKEAEEAAAKAAAEKQAAPAIVPATPEQTAQVASAPTTDAAVKEVIPPQA